MKTTRYTFVALAAAALFVALAAFLAGPQLFAQGPGDLLVTPTRALFEGGKRNEVLTLINRGSDTATYQISVMQYRMTEAGELERIESPDSGQMFATDLIRFFPRQVTIAPGETQNVRVQLRTPEGLADGEYRSHLYFRSVPKLEPLAATPDTTASAEFAVQLTAVFGVSIPVIVRQGELKGDVSIGNLALEQGASPERPVLSLTFDRQGERSVYGALKVLFRTADGRETEVGGIGGVAVYTPNLRRSIRIPLRFPEGVDPNSGTITVTYSSMSDLKPERLAAAELAVK